MTEKSVSAIRAKQYYQQHIDRRRALIAKEAQSSLKAHTLTGDTAIALWAQFIEAGSLEASINRDVRAADAPVTLEGGPM